MPRMSSTDRDFGHELARLDSLPGPSSSSRSLSSLGQQPAKSSQHSGTQTQRELPVQPAPRCSFRLLTIACAKPACLVALASRACLAVQGQCSVILIKCGPVSMLVCASKL